MMTIVAGYLVGLQRAKAADSVLLGLITLTAAAGYKAVTKWEIMTENLQLGPVFWGCFVAGISAGPFSLLVGWIFKSKGTGYIRMVSHPIIYGRLVFILPDSIRLSGT